MTAKQLVFQQEAHAKILAGINTLAQAVRVTPDIIRSGYAHSPRGSHADYNIDVHTSGRSDGIARIRWVAEGLRRAH